MTGAAWNDVKFLTIYELAVMMRISKMSAYRLVRTGELESIRVGRSYRIPEQAVISYMRDAAFTPAGIASLEPRQAPEATGRNGNEPNSNEPNSNEPNGNEP